MFYDKKVDLHYLKCSGHGGGGGASSPHFEGYARVRDYEIFPVLIRNRGCP